MTKFMEEFFKKHPRKNRKSNPPPKSHPYKSGFEATPKLKVTAPIVPFSKKQHIPIKKGEFRLDTLRKGRISQ